jgi:hypothetical protein
MAVMRIVDWRRPHDEPAQASRISTASQSRGRHAHVEDGEQRHARGVEERDRGVDQRHGHPVVLPENERRNGRGSRACTRAIQPAILPRRENSLRCRTASTIAPTIPMAPLSVGVARPRKMVPSTRVSKHQRRDDAPTGTSWIRGQPVIDRESRGIPGTPLRPEDAHEEHVQAEQQHLDRARAPGAGVHVAPTERPSWSPSTISTSEGGMSCVMVPDEAITPVARLMS